MRALKFIPLLLLWLASHVSGAKIVFFHLVSTFSHQIESWPVAEALAKRGHEVTYISSLKAKGTNPNITELVPPSVYEFVDQKINGEFDLGLRLTGKMLEMHEFLFDMSYEACDVLLSSPELQEWLEKNKKVDIAIIDSCFAECHLGLAKYLGAKPILFYMLVNWAYEYDAMGFLPQSASVPELEVYARITPMGFFDRLYNTYLTLIWRWKHYHYTFQIDELLRNKLVDGLPPSDDLVRNVSLAFYHGDVVSNYPRSLPPMFVNVAGTHCRESTQALPKEMELFINSTKPGVKNDGFVYISLGTVVQLPKLPERIRETFLDTIRALPNLKFFWKWTGPKPKNIPDNLYLSEWFPQIDILGHPRIKGFIFQNGRPSMLEALYLGVPMICFPILGDQDFNSGRLSEVGGTTKLDIGKVTVNEFKDAIQKMAFDPNVKKRAEHLQSIFRDRPMGPVDTAVWWVDYVLKYEDLSHLKTAGNEQYWFVRRQVDVWAFLSVTILTILIGVGMVGAKIVKSILGKDAKANKLKRN